MWHASPFNIMKKGNGKEGSKMLNAGVNRTATVYVSKKTIISKLIDNESKKITKVSRRGQN